MKHIVWVIIILYFLTSWFYPWEDINIHETISFSYIFDFFIFLCGIFLYKLKFNLKVEHNKGYFLRLLAVALFASLVVSIVSFSEMVTPFKYVDHLVIQLVIMAPLFEELVFRHTFFGILDNYFAKKSSTVIVSSILFSFSHAAALWAIPSIFRSFIIFQIGYTFLLGMFIGINRAKKGWTAEPIILHFIFNFVFLCAVKLSVIN